MQPLGSFFFDRFRQKLRHPGQNGRLDIDILFDHADLSESNFSSHFTG